jgi:hypothetical protein
MTHRHRSRFAPAAWLLGVVAVAAVASGLMVGGVALTVGAVMAGAAAVAACVLLLRSEAAARVALGQQRLALDATLDHRLAVQRSSADATVTALRARVDRGERDRRQLEIAVQMAMLRREPERSAGAWEQVRDARGLPAKRSA